MSGCGCYPFPNQSCNNSNYSESGPFTCRPHFPAVRKNFTVPPANTDVLIELTDTTSLTQGQGILLGSTYYQITDILDSLNIKARHNGLGAQVGTIVVAVHPAYGCYQYPVIIAGKVTLEATPDVVGIDDDRETAVGSSIVSLGAQISNYGYLGPTTIQFSAEVIAELANTPAYIGISLPVPVKAGSPFPVFSAIYDDGAGPLPAVAQAGLEGYVNYVLVGPGGSTNFTNGADKRVLVSGTYEILV